MFKAYPSEVSKQTVNCMTFTISGMTNGEKKRKYTTLKRIGWLGFAFFLIKGLIWLALFFFAGSELMQTCN
jgi:hypothetical protein